MSIRIKVLYSVLIVLALYTLWPDQHSQKPATIHVWDAHIDESGQLNVLGVTLGKTTLRQAETILHTQSERALFLELEDGKQQQETLEAYFPTSPDRARIIIELDAPRELIERIKARAHKTMVFPSGSAKIEIAPEDMIAVETLSARSITYIPPVQLDKAMVVNNFGAAKQQLHDSDGNQHLLYPTLGLDAVLPQNGKPLLQFVPPTEFHRLQQLLPDSTDQP